MSIIKYYIYKFFGVRALRLFLTEAQYEKLMIYQLRNHLAFFGCDVSDLTDEQIKEGTDRMARVIAQAGIAAQEATDGLRAFNKLARGEM